MDLLEKEFEVEITDIFKKRIKVKASTKSEAIYKAGAHYASVDDGCCGFADAESHVETNFKVLN